MPAALEAIERSARELNRYPDGGAYRLRGALAERHGVRFEEVALGAGADGVIDCLSQALLDPGDEIVCGWPSFSSYVIDAQKMGAEPRLVPLRDHRYDLEAMLDAIGPRTKIVYVCYPNNPTGTTNTRAELDAYFASVPDHVLTVIDQAYFEYVDDPDYPDAIETYFKAGRNVLVAADVLEDLRPGRAARRLRRRARDARARARQGAARLRHVDDEPGGGAREPRRRGGDRAPAPGKRSRRVRSSRRSSRRHGLEPVGPAVANFLYADVGEDATPLFESLLREGVIVRPLAGFGAPEAVRITVGDGGGSRRSRRGSFGRRRRQRTAVRSTSHVSSPPALSASPACCAATRASGPSSLRRSRRASGPGSRSIALSIDVYDRTGSATWVSALLVADFLPSVAIGLLLGPLIDRLSRRRIMVVADLARLGIFVALPVHEQRRRRSSSSPRPPASRRASSGRPRTPGCRTSSTAADLADANSLLRGGRVPVVDDRHGARRRDRRRLRAPTSPTGSTP